jgi:hypothetical protein
MGELQLIGLNAILHHEKPPTHSLFRSMKPVTTGDLNGCECFVLDALKKPGSDFLRRLKDLSKLS